MFINETTSQFWNLSGEYVEISIDIEPDSNDSVVSAAPLQTISPLVSFHTFKLFRILIDLILTNAMSLFGCCSNIVNIVVYLNMGLADTTTINILALSVLDLLACSTTLIILISVNPLTASWTLPSGAPLLDLGFAALIVYYPCVACSAWVTALLSVERCLCIVVPLKVSSVKKKLFKRKRSRWLVIVLPFTV